MTHTGGIRADSFRSTRSTGVQSELSLRVSVGATHIGGSDSPPAQTCSARPYRPPAKGGLLYSRRSPGVHSLERGGYIAAPLAPLLRNYVPTEPAEERGPLNTSGM